MLFHITLYKVNFGKEMVAVSDKRSREQKNCSGSIGVNFPDLRYIVNWGPARNLLDQLQQSGRAAVVMERNHMHELVDNMNQVTAPWFPRETIKATS